MLLSKCLQLGVLDPRMSTQLRESAEAIGSTTALASSAASDINFNHKVTGMVAVIDHDKLV